MKIEMETYDRGARSRAPSVSELAAAEQKNIRQFNAALDQLEKGEVVAVTVNGGSRRWVLTRKDPRERTR